MTTTGGGGSRQALESMILGYAVGLRTGKSQPNQVESDCDSKSQD
ncbi:MAG: hypothetical protein RLP02_11645 [Coleofasciculus sp. C2-GNP5-27]